MNVIGINRPVPGRVEARGGIGTPVNDLNRPEKGVKSGQYDGPIMPRLAVQDLLCSLWDYPPVPFCPCVSVSNMIRTYR